MTDTSGTSPEASVQIHHGFRPGNRDADISADIAYQPVYKPLLVAGGRIAEHRFKPIMSSQNSIAGLFPGMSADTVFNGNFTVVEDDSPRNAAEILEHLNQSIQEALFILPVVGQYHGSAAVAEPDAEQVNYGLDAF